LNDESEFVQLIKQIPVGLNNRHAVCVLCQRLSRFHFHDWIPESLNEIRKKLCPVAEVLKTENVAATSMAVRIDLSNEVNRVMGWSVSSLIRKTRKQLNRPKYSPKEVNEEELVEKLKLLKSMTVFEHEILDNEEYIAKFYCPFHRLLNDGFLALMSPTYIGLGLALLQTFADAVNEKELKKNGDETLKKAVA
jgi:hypothetical protein